MTAPPRFRAKTGEGGKKAPHAKCRATFPKADRFGEHRIFKVWLPRELPTGLQNGGLERAEAGLLIIAVGSGVPDTSPCLPLTASRTTQRFMIDEGTHFEELF